MRKLLTVLAAIGVLSTMFVGAAVAGEQDWVLLIRGGSGGAFTSPSQTGHSPLWMGTTPTSTDGFDSNVDGYGVLVPPPPSNDMVVAAWYRPDWPVTPSGTPDHPFASRDLKTKLEPGEVKTWTDMVVWVTPGYDKADLVLFVATPGGTRQAPASIGGKPVKYKFQLTYAPEGYSGPTEWIFDAPAPIASGQALVGEIRLPVIAGVKSGVPPISGTGPLAATQTGGYRLNVVVPEPGSMLVLASGITGLMGLIARRRSA
jgi:hypothetical protein